MHCTYILFILIIFSVGLPHEEMITCCLKCRFHQTSSLPLISWFPSSAAIWSVGLNATLFLVFQAVSETKGAEEKTTFACGGGSGGGSTNTGKWLRAAVRTRRKLTACFFLLPHYVRKVAAFHILRPT